MGFYRYIDYAIKCLIRKIIYSKWFWRILFLIIMVAICFSCCTSAFATEGTKVTTTKLDGLVYDSTTTPSTLVASSTFKGYYFPITEGYTYKVEYSTSGGTSRMMLTKEVPAVGVTFYDLFYNFESGYTFFANYDGYAYVCTTTTLSVTAYKFLEGYDVVGTNWASAGSRSFGSDCTIESSSSTFMYYAFLENNVEYTFEATNPTSSILSLSAAFSSDVPSIGGKYDMITTYTFKANDTTSWTIKGNNSYFLIVIPSGSSLSFPLLYTLKKVEDATISDVDNSLQDINSNISTSTESITNSVDNLENTMSSTEYDESTINIDTSVTDDIDDSSSTGLFTAVFDNLSNLISSSNWSTVETIDIGLPYTDATIQLRSDLLSKIVGNSLLATLINVAWYSLFGLYVFRFSTNIFHAIKSGDILNGLNLNNEVISSTML